MLKYGEHTLHHLEVIKTIQESDLANKEEPLQRLIRWDTFEQSEIPTQRAKFKTLFKSFTDEYGRKEKETEVGISALTVVDEEEEETTTHRR